MHATTLRFSLLSRFLPLMLALGAALLTCSFAAPVAAKGRVVWKKTTIDENDKRESWYLKMEIHLPRPPSVAYVPMKFEFQPTAYYERALVDDREEPLERTVPLRNQQAIIESTDVGFMDAGTGEIQSRTRFSFRVTRAHDFKAGEYKVTIKDARDGSTIGRTTTLKLTGKNPVIDRRSIVFAGKKKDEKEEQEEAPADETSDEAPAASEQSSNEEVPEPEEGNEPPSVEERPGGGCHHGPSHGTPYAWLIVLGLGGAALYSRKRPS